MLLAQKVSSVRLVLHVSIVFGLGFPLGEMLGESISDRLNDADV